MKEDLTFPEPNPAFLKNVKGLFSYYKSPHLAPLDLLKETVDMINPSYQVVGLEGIGLEGAVIKVTDVSDTPLAIKIAKMGFTKGGKKKKKIYSLFRYKTEDENTFRGRFITGCKAQRDIDLLVTQEGIDFLEIPGGIEVFTYPSLFVKMSFLSGPPLLGYLQEINDFASSMKLYAQLLKSVEFIHSYGYIHRDLKSDNIRITGVRANYPKIGIMDWTMAKPCGVDGVTIAGVSIGTPGYISPKLSVDGDAKSANYSDDIFSLGMMLYEFCSKNKLPGVNNPMLLVTDRAAQLRYTQDIGKLIPEFLLPVFRKATHAKESERYQTVSPFLYEFTKVIEENGLIVDEGTWNFSRQEITITDLEDKISKLSSIVEASVISIQDIYARLAHISFVTSPQESGSKTKKVISTSSVRSDLTKTQKVETVKIDKPKSDKSDIEKAIDVVFPEE